MASSLPDNPSLDRLRAEARRLQRGVTADTAGATELVQRHHPRPGAALANAPQRFSLHDAQLTVARSVGFSGWPALVHYLELAADLTVDPAKVDDDALDPDDRFCALASLRYDDRDAPPRHRAAADLLAGDPALVDRHVWAAASATDPAALARHLAVEPGLARARGGPFGWVPLIYLCYSRAPLGRTEDETMAAATRLLDAGADANAGYLWRGMATPFTALTGAFGEGEQGPRRQPRHPFAPALATLLLERGAHPVDQQTLYNRMFRPDDAHLHLLFAYGLATAGPSIWERRLGEAMETRDEMWARQVAGPPSTASPADSSSLPATASTCPVRNQWSRRRRRIRTAATNRARRRCIMPPGTATWSGSGACSPRVPTRPSPTGDSALRRWAGPSTPTRPRPPTY